MNDTVKSLLIIGLLTFLLAWGCHSCNKAIDREYPPIHTDWNAIERENAVTNSYSSQPSSEEKQWDREQWEADKKRRTEKFADMMRAFGDAEEGWKREHEDEEYHDVMSTYDEGYENGFRDRQSGCDRDETEYGIQYDEGYNDGYGD